jgi:hypothetical protein
MVEKEEIDLDNNKPRREKGKLFFFGVGFLAGTALAYLRLQPFGKAYLIHSTQLVELVITLLGMGFGFAMLMRYPFLKIKKKMIEGQGKTPVTLAYFGKGGQLKLNVVAEDIVHRIGRGLYNTLEPTFTFMGMPGYLIHEECMVSLKIDKEAIMRMKEEKAEEIAKATAHQGRGGIARQFTLRALNPFYLRDVYDMVEDLALAAAKTKADRQILMAVLFSAAAMLFSIIVGYMVMQNAEVLKAIGRSVNDIGAMVQAMWGGS